MINRLQVLSDQFKNGHLEKVAYISKMYNFHRILWEYHEFIQNKNILSIEISKKTVTITTYDNISMVFNPEDERAIPMEILNFGDYEAAELRMMSKFLSRNSTVLDIGANIGWNCLNLSKYVPKGRVIAFEPIKNIFCYLKKNIHLNNAKNVRLYNFGLSDKKGVFEFYYDPKISIATSLRNLHDDKQKQKIICRVKRLDDFILSITPQISFIKCDVEGAELFVIRGALKTLKKMKPVLFLEMSRKWSAKFGYHPNDLIRLLGDIGYECYYVKKEKLIRIKKVNDKTVPVNFYFLHYQKHEKYIKKLT